MSNVTLVIVLGVASLANMLIGGIVLLRNGSAKLNRVFFALSTAVAGWTITNALFQILPATTSKFLVALLSYGFAIMLALFFYLFCVTLTENYYPERRKLRVLLLAAGVIMGAISIMPGVVGVGVDDRSSIVTNNGWLMIYGLVLVTLLLRGIYILVRSRRTSPVKERNLVNVVIISLTLALLVGVFFNLILPLVNIYTYVGFGPIGSLILVAGIAYTIIRHKLFDIKLIIARSLAYIASLLAFATVYGFVVFGLSQAVFGLHFSTLVQVVLSISTGVAALSFNYFRVLFDKVTNRLFYRDAYDPKELFAKYNEALVSTIDLDLLLKRTSDVVAAYLKSEFCLIGVKDGTEAEYRIVGTNTINFRPDDIAALRKLTPRIHHAVIVADDLMPEQEKIRRLLKRYDISLLVRMTTNLQVTQEGLGYLVLGPKKSGNPYNSQDIKVIEALSNELIIALQNALRFEEIERFNETLQEEIEIATRKLKVSNRQLKKLNDNKDDFIGMASHQLRTPLTSAKGYISLVLDGDAGKINKNQRELLEQAFASSQRMVYLIADLLNVSRLKTGKFTVERGSTHLPQLVHDEMDQLKKAMAAHDIKLTFEAPKHFPVLQLDATKTRQVVMNFLDNALYYTPNGGHIKVELKELPKSVEFRVTDNGIGVPKEEQHNLFTKFYRAKNAQRARPDGTGLGLYMAQKVIVKQGGTIIFDSKEGKGSTFGFSFPKELPANSPTIPELAVAEK